MTESHELAFDWADLTLAGTLTLPDGDHPHPGVVMLQGSGPADRDSGGFFPPLRQVFLDRGLATFAFDKPGCGASSGNWREHGLYARADQASAAVEVVRRHPAIDATNVGLWGHSQGGWLAQMVAGRRPELRFAIANSGPSIDVAEQNLYGCEHTLRAEGFSEEAIATAMAFLDRLHEAARQGEGRAAVGRRLVDPVRQESWFPAVMASEHPDDWGFLKIIIGEDYQPPEALARVRCPFLAVYGGLDLLVPAWKGAEESGLALERADTDDATVVVFPGGDHRLMDPTTGDFVAGYLELLGDWTARRAEPAGQDGGAG